MGIERHLFKVFLVTSDTLSKKLIVKAKSIDEATGVVIAKYRRLLSEIDEKSEGDVDVDLKFTELEEELTEI